MVLQLSSHCNNESWDQCICDPDDQSLCTDCQDGYFLTLSYDPSLQHCCDFNCKTCENHQDASECLSCHESYYLSGSQCLQCPNDCKVCNTSGVCTQCDKTNYYLDLNDDCQICNENCKTCEYDNVTLNKVVCLNCPKNNQVIRPDTGECMDCPDACSLCSIEGEFLRCTQCISEEYALTQAGDCIKISCNDCVDCQFDLQNQAICVTCIEKYSPDNNGTCQQCSNTCQSCYFDYQQNQYGDEICTQCIDPSSYYIEQNECKKCPIYCIDSVCQLNDNNEFVCSSGCVTTVSYWFYDMNNSISYYNNLQNVCIQCGIVNCTSCDTLEGSGSYCTYCIDYLYYLHPDKKVIYAPDVETYKKNQENGSMPTYTVHPDTKECIQCPENCPQCVYSESSQTTVCIMCYQDYFLNDSSIDVIQSFNQQTFTFQGQVYGVGDYRAYKNGTCEKCQERCQYCNYQQDTHICTKCEPNYFLYGNICVTCEEHIPGCQVCTQDTDIRCNKCKNSDTYNINYCKSNILQNNVIQLVIILSMVLILKNYS